jgi:predicted alpha-1,2-mannosidase
MRNAKFFSFKKSTLLLVLFGLNASQIHAQQPADYVNPMVGAVTYGEETTDVHGFGKTFPGAATPFGLVQLSPDTRTGGDNGPGYSWNHKTIEGFSFTHMSGIGWYGDLGNFLVMPTTGPLHTAKGSDDLPEQGYRSRYSHDSEIAKAGYYAVTLVDYNIRAELTAAPRAGMIRFTFPENKESRIQIDLSRRIGGTSTEQYFKVIDDSTFCGWMTCPPEGGGWGNGAGRADYTVYFWCQFSKPMKKFGAWSVDIPDGWPRKREDVTRERYQKRVSRADVSFGEREMQGEHLGFFTEFATSENEQVLVKSGISFTSIEGARENLMHDIPHWDFDKVRKQARDLWNAALGRVKVDGGSGKENRIFYTALYHTLLDPRNFADVNGDYTGADKNIHKNNEFTYRTIFSGWDVFRSQFPLQTIINPHIVNDEINSLIQMADLSGRNYFPRWEFLNAFSGCMIGNPAVSVVADAYSKGIRDYDVDKAFLYSRNSVDTFSNMPEGYTANNLSQTLEYAYFDWCFARFADMRGEHKVARDYYERSKAYKNVWDPKVKWFRTRTSDGSWLKWEGKIAHGQGCVESNPFQQGWFVPHDVPGLVDLMGMEFLQKELLSFFEQAPDNFKWNDYYNHPNEPVHHVPFLFNAVGLPWKTQEWTRKICSNAYGDDVFGLCGNEDVGQMSAWYVLSAIGLHPLCPGDGKYQITSPVFSEIDIELDTRYYRGESFRISAKNNSPENVYIQSAILNGTPLKHSWLSHTELAAGGELVLQMGAEPNLNWGGGQ